MKKKKKQKVAAAISISGASYARLRARARRENTTMRYLVEMAIAADIGLQEPEKKFTRRYRGPAKT